MNAHETKRIAVISDVHGNLPPLKVKEDSYGTKAAFQHYGLTSRADNLSRFAPLVGDPDDRDLDRLFCDIDADVVFYGHDHCPSDVHGRAHYINPGALGCSSNCYGRMNIAEFRSDGTYSIDAAKVAYDRQAVLQALQSRKVPEGDFIARAFFAKDSAGCG